jgi:glycerol kinase
MQFQADILGAKVVRPHITETTALGAAYLAGLAVGFWDSIATISSQWQVDKTFSPNMDSGQRNILTKGWKRAIRAAQAWTENNE